MRPESHRLQSEHRLIEQSEHEKIEKKNHNRETQTEKKNTDLWEQDYKRNPENENKREVKKAAIQIARETHKLMVTGGSHRIVY